MSELAQLTVICIVHRLFSVLHAFEGKLRTKSRHSLSDFLHVLIFRSLDDVGYCEGVQQVPVCFQSFRDGFYIRPCVHLNERRPAWDMNSFDWQPPIVWRVGATFLQVLRCGVLCAGHGL